MGYRKRGRGRLMIPGGMEKVIMLTKDQKESLRLCMELGIKEMEQTIKTNKEHLSEMDEKTKPLIENHMRKTDVRIKQAKEAMEWVELNQ